MRASLLPGATLSLLGLGLGGVRAAAGGGPRVARARHSGAIRILNYNVLHEKMMLMNTESSVRPAGYATAMNYSLGAKTGAEALEAVANSPFDKVELWWPWDTPHPSEQQMRQLVDALAKGRPENPRQLVALNLWAGDLAAGDRGVLHLVGPKEGADGAGAGTDPDAESGDPAITEELIEHLNVIEYLHRLTGVRRFNVLVGRGGRVLQRRQVRAFAAVAKRLARFGGIALIEPLSGIENYPVTSIKEAAPLVAAGGRLLIDAYHLAANGEDWTWLASRGAEYELWPEHIQIADFPGRGAPGTGDAPLEEWVNQLREAGYEGEVVLEHV